MSEQHAIWYIPTNSAVVLFQEGILRSTLMRVTGERKENFPERPTKIQIKADLFVKEKETLVRTLVFKHAQVDGTADLCDIITSIGFKDLPVSRILFRAFGYEINLLSTSIKKRLENDPLLEDLYDWKSNKEAYKRKIKPAILDGFFKPITAPQRDHVQFLKRKIGGHIRLEILKSTGVRFTTRIIK